MSSTEFAEWMGYNEWEPFGHPRFDLGFALVAMVMNNRWLGKGESPAKLDDFILKFKESDSEAAARLNAQVEAVFGRPSQGSGE